MNDKCDHEKLKQEQPLVAQSKYRLKVAHEKKSKQCLKELAPVANWL